MSEKIIAEFSSKPNLQFPSPVVYSEIAQLVPAMCLITNSNPGRHVRAGGWRFVVKGGFVFAFPPAGNCVFLIDGVPARTVLDLLS